MFREIVAGMFGFQQRRARVKSSRGVRMMVYGRWVSVGNAGFRGRLWGMWLKESVCGVETGVQLIADVILKFFATYFGNSGDFESVRVGSFQPSFDYRVFYVNVVYVCYFCCILLNTLYIFYDLIQDVPFMTLKYFMD